MCHKAMLWIPNADSLHGLNGQLHALAAFNLGIGRGATGIEDQCDPKAVSTF